MMPNQQIQKKYFADFRVRVANTMIEASKNKRPVNNIQAEEMVWQQLEEELFREAVLT
jgi:FKBP-type peptidyl-prolyl cis-trans isomerase 2